MSEQINMHGFEEISSKSIGEYKTEGRLFRHKKSGAQLLSLSNDDTNKVFGICFRTPPEDSTGIAHILEHSVLCGSRKYPVKEPFVELLKGSLQTFLNAFTFPDKTCYPVASQNRQDFYNLIDVYLDSVFYPRISPEILQQEGWHYELENPEDPLTYRGVVFNEMKGVYSSPDSLLMEYVQHTLFPDNTYGLDSGGDPRVIPKLTYEQFKDFHARYYHPSNARLYFYGDDPLEKRLEIAAGYLDDFESLEVDSSVTLQTPHTQPEEHIRYYAADSESDNNHSMFTISWLLGETSNLEDNLALHILEYILLGMPGSPLRRALIESGLGEDLAGVGLENELRQMFFSTGLKGIKQEDRDKVEKLILDTLEKLGNKPLPEDLVEAGLNTIEFQLRENNTGNFPRGLSLMLRSLTTWLYDNDPFALLAFETPLQKIRQAAKNDSMFFSNLIQRFLLNNGHRISLLLAPDTGMAERIAREEAEELAGVKTAMSPEEIEQTIAQTKRLHELQEKPDAPEDLARIPRLHPSDLAKEIKKTPEEQSDIEGVPVYVHPLSCNGIVYLDLAFRLDGFSLEEMSFTAILGKALLEMGTDKFDYSELGTRISRFTGGIRSKAMVHSLAESDRALSLQLLKCRVTAGRIPKLIEILGDILGSTNLADKDRFRQIVLERKASLEAALVPRGHSYVSSRLQATLNASGRIGDAQSGIAYLQFLRKLLEKIDEDWNAVQQKLESLLRELLTKKRLLINITADEEHCPAVKKNLESLTKFLANSAAVAKQDIPGEQQIEKEALLLPTQVNYVGMGGNLYSTGHTFHGSFQVVRRYLRTAYLWDQIRVQGGAYGAFCLFDRLSGNFILCTYRDPQLERSLDVYRNLPEHLINLELNEEELEKSIVGAIGEQDAYKLPDAAGFSAFIRSLRGITDDERQKIREEILAASLEHFRECGKVLARALSSASIIVLTAPEHKKRLEEYLGTTLQELRLHGVQV